MKLGMLKKPAGGTDRAVTNLAFGGTDRKTLFATSDKRLSSIQVNVPGPN
jgi:sugar lactone lactonase YvrE